eukprot:5225134-Prymnesium_polylepis.1
MKPFGLESEVLKVTESEVLFLDAKLPASQANKAPAPDTGNRVAPEIEDKISTTKFIVSRGRCHGDYFCVWQWHEEPVSSL